MTTTTSYVCDLRNALDAGEAGHKAANLALLMRAGFPVPDGLVLLADALDHALDQAGLSPAASAAAVAAIDVPVEVGAAVREAVRRWGDTPLAVRSSGAAEDLPSASYAGLYTTVLDVSGEDELMAAVRRCWASAFGDVVRSYHPQLASERPRLAVLIQPMVRARAAGVAFTADPVTGDPDAVTVEAVLGTGERLVSGSATPDEWVVRGDSAVRRGGGEEAIDAAVVRAVAALARQVEQHQGCPQDVEWALAGGTVVLLQARPITALRERPIDPVPVPVEPPHGYWLREASHAPVPWMPMGQAWLRLRTPALRGMCEQFGFLFETLDVRDIGGWEYFRVVPIGGRDRPAPPKALVPLLFRLVPSLRRRVKECVTAMRADVAGNLVRRWYQEWQPDLARRETELRNVDLTGLTDVDLDAHTASLLELIGLGLRMHFDLHGAIGVTLANLAFTCRDLLGEEVLAFDLLAGLSEKSTEPSRALARLADLADRLPALKRRIIQRAPVGTVLAVDEAFAAAFAEFLGAHGCRALRYEIAEPNLDERPDLVLGLVADQLTAGFDPAQTAAALAERRERATADARKRLMSVPDRARFDRALLAAEAAYPVREDNEYFTVGVLLALLRRSALEFGRRLAERGQLELRDDVFFLDLDQARTALRDGADQLGLVVRRKGERAWVLDHSGPTSYGKDPGPPPPFASLPPEARLANEGLLWAVDRVMGPQAQAERGENGVVTGIPAAPGSYTGSVRVIRSEAEFDRLRAGDVLVCPVTSPVWSVLFPSIGALVTDSGGVLSHPAIIAREYGIPAVVATGNGTSVLCDGQVVTVDGTAGVVRA